MSKDTYPMPEDELVKRLRRIASPDEITGDGATEDMTGPAANEMRHRMKEAGKIADQLETYTTNKIILELESLIKGQYVSDFTKMIQARANELKVAHNHRKDKKA